MAQATPMSSVSDQNAIAKSTCARQSLVDLFPNPASGATPPSDGQGVRQRRPCRKPRARPHSQRFWRMRRRLEIFRLRQARPAGNQTRANASEHILRYRATRSAGRAVSVKVDAVSWRKLFRLWKSRRARYVHRTGVDRRALPFCSGRAVWPIEGVSFRLRPPSIPRAWRRAKAPSVPPLSVAPPLACGVLVETTQGTLRDIDRIADLAMTVAADCTSIKIEGHQPMRNVHHHSHQIAGPDSHHSTGAVTHVMAHPRRSGHPHVPKHPALRPHPTCLGYPPICHSCEHQHRPPRQTPTPEAGRLDLPLRLSTRRKIRECSWRGSDGKSSAVLQTGQWSKGTRAQGNSLVQNSILAAAQFAVLARRMPWEFIRVVGPKLRRSAEPRYDASKLQLPPRIPRKEPDSGPT